VIVSFFFIARRFNRMQAEAATLQTAIKA
jgi:hypothetical protein